MMSRRHCVKAKAGSKLLSKAGTLECCHPKNEGLGQGVSPALHPIEGGGGQRSRAGFCPQEYLQHNRVELFLWWQQQHNPAYPNTCCRVIQVLARISFNDHGFASVVPGVVAVPVHARRWPYGQRPGNTETIILNHHVLTLTWAKSRCFKGDKRS